ncbi:hypothetical protein SLS60_001506 [Paraconiothyrium brasiliense]|uniref:BZIP domain-containing protein n=1 Tax=Paraconiothyrium brasiliense TaxID=300254 RepID=A0ABR3SAC8_9PLEO
MGYSTFVAPISPFPHHRIQGWPAFEGGVTQTLTISPYLLNLESIEESDRLSHNQEVSPSELPRNFDEKSFVPTDQLKSGPPIPEKPLEIFQERGRASLSHTGIHDSSSNHRDASGKAPLNPFEAHNSTRQTVTDPEPRKRGRGRPRVRPLVIDASVARESHLEKNRIAADKCRQRQKAYIATITADASTISSKNKALKAEVAALREQLLDLKNELLSHAGCGSWTIDQYIAQSASGQFGTKESSIHTASPKDLNQSEGSPISSSLTDEHTSQTADVTESLSSQESSNSSVDMDDNDCLWLLEGSDHLCM